MSLRRGMMGGGGAYVDYNAYVATLGPAYWWKLDETSGTSLANSGSQSSAALTTFNSPTLNVSPPAGFEPLGKGITFNGTNQYAEGANNSVPSTGDFTYVLFVKLANTAQTNRYVYDKANRGTILYGYSSGNFEFYSASSHSGSDPRTGSQIAAGNTDLHMIVYRRRGSDNNWAGFKDGVNVFSVTRTFNLNASGNSAIGGAETASDYVAATIFDMQVYNSALSNGQIADLWNKAQGL